MTQVELQDLIAQSVKYQKGVLLLEMLSQTLELENPSMAAISLKMKELSESMEKIQLEVSGKEAQGEQAASD